MTSGGGVGGSGTVLDVLIVELQARTDRLESELRGVQGQAEGHGKKAGGFFGSAFSVAVGGLLTNGIQAAMGAVSGFIKDGFQGVQEGQDAVAQLEQVIKSTGNAAGVSSQHLQDFSASIQANTKFTAEQSEAAQSMLLTFTNIGAKGGIFDQATRTALDMSQALGGEASDKAMMLGKALNDPVKGITALTRVGVTFSDEQKETIKTMAKMGDTAGAQTVILKELQKEFGGSAEAAGKTFSGQMERAKNALGEVAESLAGTLMPYLQKFLDFAIQHIPEIQAVVTRVAGAVGQAFDFVAKNVIPVLLGVMGELRPTITRVAAVFQDLGGQAQAGFGKIAPVVQVVWSVLQPIFKALGPLVAAAFELIQAVWNTVLRPVLSTMAPYFEAVFRNIGVVVQTVIRVVTGLIHGISALLSGDFKMAGKAFEAIWEQMRGAVLKIAGNMARGIIGVIENIAPGLIEAGKHIVDGLVQGITGGASRAVEAAKNLAVGVLQSAKDALGIQSPSREFAAVGVFAGAGFALGLDQVAPKVADAAKNLALGALAGAKAGLGAGLGDLGGALGLAGVKTGADLGTAIGKSAEGSAGPAVKASMGAAIQSVQDLVKARADLEKSIGFDKWTEGLKSATTAQLTHAQAVARAAGDSEKYGAVTAELTRRQDELRQGLQKAADAARQHAEQLAANRQALESSLKYDSWKKGLDSWTDAQLQNGLAAARATGDQTRYGDVLGVIQARAASAKQAVLDFTAALEAGRRAGNASLAGVRNDPRAYLDARDTPAGTPVERLSAKEVLARSAGRLPTNEVEYRTFIAAMGDLNKAGLLQEGVLDDLAAKLNRYGNEVSQVRPKVEGLAAAVGPEGVTGSRVITRAPGGDTEAPRVRQGTTFGVEASRANVKAAEAEDLANQKALDSLKAWGEYLKGLNFEGWKNGLRSLTDAQLMQAAASAAQAHNTAEATAIQAEMARRTGETNRATDEAAKKTQAWNDNLNKIEFSKWVAGLANLTQGQLDQALASARASQNTERYNAVLAELERRAKLAVDPLKGLTDGLAQLFSAVGAGGLASVVGQIGQLGGAIGGIKSSISAVGPAFGQSFGAGVSAIGGVIGAVSAGIGIVNNIGQAIYDLLPGVAEWKRGLLAVADAEKKVAQVSAGLFGNPYAGAASQDAANRENLASAPWWKRLWWGLTNSAPQVMNDAAAKILTVASGVFQNLGSGLSDLLSSTLMDGFEQGDLSNVGGSIEKFMNKFMAQMAIQLIITGSKLKELIKTYSDDYAKSMEDGVIDSTEQASLNADVAGIKAEGRNIEKTAGAILPNLPGFGEGKAKPAAAAAAGPSLPNLPASGTVGVNSASLPSGGQAPGINVGAMLDLTPLTNFGTAMGALTGQFGQHVDRFGQAVDRFGQLGTNWARLNTQN